MSNYIARHRRTGPGWRQRLSPLLTATLEEETRAETVTASLFTPAHAPVPVRRTRATKGL
jgi:hypothetical protein